MSELKPCPFCGSPAYSYHDNCIDFAGVKCDLGGCVCADILITENNWNTRPIEDALNARIAELSQAVGLITTLKPTMVMDADHPLEMAKEVAEYVNARIAELEAERRWIPVSERLPEDMTEVLVLHGLCVTTANYYHYRGLLSKHGWYQIDGMKLGVSWATHWMPLPKPPEVK